MSAFTAGSEVCFQRVNVFARVTIVFVVVEMQAEGKTCLVHVFGSSALCRRCGFVGFIRPSPPAHIGAAVKPSVKQTYESVVVYWKTIDCPLRHGRTSQWPT